MKSSNHTWYRASAKGPAKCRQKGTGKVGKSKAGVMKKDTRLSVGVAQPSKEHLSRGANNDIVTRTKHHFDSSGVLSVEKGRKERKLKLGLT